MNYILFLSILILSLNVQAEIKPEGSMIPLMCGENILEIPGGETGSPVTVCLMTVTNSKTSEAYKQYSEKKIIQVRRHVGSRYFIVTGEFDDCSEVGSQEWQGFELNAFEKGPYSYPEGINLASPRIKVIATKNGSNLILRGEFFQVTLEPVFNTFSR